ncbi:MAG: hypothetical protein ACTHJ4_03740 [Candidatus Nucleicultricaceae bacterium]
MNNLLKFSLFLSLSINSIACASRLSLQEEQELEKRANSIEVLHKIILRERAREENPRPIVATSRKHPHQQTRVAEEGRTIKQRKTTNTSRAIMKATPIDKELEIAYPQPQTIQKNSVVIDLEDEVSLERALNQYNPERQRNRIEEIYVTWFRELDTKSGLQFAQKQKQFFEDNDPNNPFVNFMVQLEMQMARKNLRELAECNPIYPILIKAGFTPKEIKNAKETLFLNFYDE